MFGVLKLVPWGGIFGFLKTNIIPILIVLLLVFTHYKTYNWGADGVREEFAEARAEQLEKEVKLREKEAALNARKGEEVTRRVAKADASAATKKEEINEHLQTTDDCTLTADDIELLKSLGNEINSN